MTYELYHEPIRIRIKNFIRKILKSSSFGRKLYPFFQKRWRAYNIPKRRRLLQTQGAEALSRLHSLLTLNGVRYYCDYGTLIGFVRDHGFIVHDDDIDISIEVGTSRPATVLKLFMDAGYGFTHAFKYEGKITEFSVMDSTGIPIDVFFPDVHEVPTKIFGYQPIWDPKREYPSENANTQIEYVFAKPVDFMKYNVLGVETIIPGNYDEVLTSEYGPWKVPDAKFNTVTDRVHRELPGFAFRVTQEEALAM